MKPFAHSAPPSLSLIPRLYMPDAIPPGATLALNEPALRHVQALRLKAGDSVTLFNGDGNEYAAELIELSRRGAVALVRGMSAVDRESPLDLTLVQGVCAADRMDLVIQKATELGVRAIQPITTSRSIVRLNSERQERRQQHWQNVAIAACEQSGRNRIPDVRGSLSFGHYLAQLVPVSDPSAALQARLFLSPSAERSLKDLPQAPALALCVGPEGGFSADEIDLLVSRNFTAVRLGPRVLRTETAPLAALAVLQALWGDF